MERQVELLLRASTLGAQPGRDVPVLAVANTLWACDELLLNEDFRAELAGWPGGRVATRRLPATRRRLVR